MKRYQACLKIGAYCALACVLTACDDYNSAPIYISTDGATPTALIQASDGNFYGTTADGGQFAIGTVFKVTPGGVETILYSFGASPTDGATPVSLIEGSDGNFYGVTGSGGTGRCQFGCGTVFRVTPGGVETVLYSFSGGADGGQPNSLIQATDGNLYGTTFFGGAGGTVCLSDCGVAFRVTTAGVETVVYSFAASGSTDGTRPVGLIQGTDGNFYGMTFRGGTANQGTVFKLTPAGAATLLHSFTGGADGAGPESSLVEGSDGNFYGTAENGGGTAGVCPGGCGIAFNITPAGVLTVLHAFAGGPADGALPETALIQASDGNFYGTTSAGGNPDAANCSSGCGTAFRMTSTGATSTLYNFAPYSGAGAPSPSSLLQGTDGNFYGTTQNAGQFGFGSVFKMTAGGTTSVLYSFGANSYP